MKTREQVTATADFPAEPWFEGDLRPRDLAWKEVLRKCAVQASSRGLKLTGDEPRPNRSMLYMVAVDPGNGDEDFLVECTRSEATHVRLTVSAWAEPI